MDFSSDFFSKAQQKYKYVPRRSRNTKQKSSTESQTDPFICVPNELILDNPIQSCGVNRIFLVAFCIIAWHRTYFETSYLTIRQVLEACHYTCSRKKPKIFEEVIGSLYFLDSSRYISLCDFDDEYISYDTIIEIKINTELFDKGSHFTLLREKDYQLIMQPESKQSKENLLHSFLYICAHMCRKTEPKIEKPDESLPYYMRKKTSVTEMLEKDREFLSDPSPPEAYFESEEKACSELSMSKQTFSECLAYLCSLDHPLLVRRSLGYVFKDGHPTKKKYPTIYVLNQPGYNAELNKAEKLIRENKEKENAEKENQKETP